MHEGVLEIRRHFHNLIKITTNQMRMFHEKHGSMMAEGLEERERLCIELGLLTKSAAAMVYNVASALPEVLSSEEDDDEDCLLSKLQTPLSSQQGQESNGKRPRRGSPAGSQPTRKTP